MSAVLLPFRAGEVDWDGFARHVERTAAAGLVPAVNMDTGYVQLLDAPTRKRVLATAKSSCAGPFVAGAELADSPGAAFDADGYRTAMDEIQAAGGTPIVFPSYGLNAGSDEEWVAAYRALARDCDRFLAFELGPMFVPYGRIPGLGAYRELLAIPACVGAKHSSLSRAKEWERLRLRDEVRPDFQVLTGNDLAIDMVMYGSDYLLGLATFAPEAFAARDRAWAKSDPAFFAWNDVLQYLGCFAFREPVPAYKHDAAMFLHLRGWTEASETHPRAPRRPEADREVLAGVLRQLEALA